MSLICLDMWMDSPSLPRQAFTSGAKLILRFCLKVSIFCFVMISSVIRRVVLYPSPGQKLSPTPREESGSKTGNSRQIRGGVNTLRFTAKYTSLYCTNLLRGVSVHST